MSEDKKIKFKVVMGEGQSKTIKRLGKTPSNFEELNSMIFKRLSDRLQDEEEYFIYYEDMNNGMIRVEDDTDLVSALDYWGLYDMHSLKFYGKF